MAGQAHQSRSLVVLAGMLSAGGAGIGIWFWQTEADFASRFDNALASNLQWVGVALTLIGLAGVLFAWHRFREFDG